MPVCIQKFEGDRLISRICADDEPFPRRPGEIYDRVSSCAQCPTYPLSTDIESIKEELIKIIVETIREEHHDHHH